MIGTSQEAIEGFLERKLPFRWENPDHGDNKVDMWKTPMAGEILKKDEVHLAALLRGRNNQTHHFRLCEHGALTQGSTKRYDHPVKSAKYKARRESLENQREGRKGESIGRRGKLSMKAQLEE